MRVEQFQLYAVRFDTLRPIHYPSQARNCNAMCCSLTEHIEHFRGHESQGGSSGMRQFPTLHLCSALHTQRTACIEQRALLASRTRVQFERDLRSPRDVEFSEDAAHVCRDRVW